MICNGMIYTLMRLYLKQLLTHCSRFIVMNYIQFIHWYTSGLLIVYISGRYRGPKVY
ncbi:hypothetical protein C8R41DRAFT_845395 [Lentinula lateritia]|uniref:Very-long-chain 3-oxoacyl-CoA synthase n=1 Tax=Lentinula lateritia TaxID=40482 RepID=A0ABQ8V7U3_9AGAR|nr:hypothetical protein C8R41DRAFT_845395 [Lentinula lateritia]